MSRKIVRYNVRRHFNSTRKFLLNVWACKSVGLCCKHLQFCTLPTLRLSLIVVQLKTSAVRLLQSNVVVSMAAPTIQTT